MSTKLILTGHDYSGKSSVLSRIWKEKNDGKMSYIHLSYREPTNKEFYSNTLEFSNFIMDRCFLDELIYPIVFGRKQNLSRLEARELVDKCRDKKIPIIILTCSEEEIMNRIVKRKEVEEEPEVLKNILLIKDMYKQVADYYGLPVIDTTGKTIEEVYEEVEDYLREYNRDFVIRY